MAKGKVVSDSGKPDGSREHPIIVDFGVRKAKLIDSDKAGFETEAERRIGRLHLIATLVESCEVALEPEEMESLGELLHHTANDFASFGWAHLFEEDELPPAEETAQ